MKKTMFVKTVLLLIVLMTTILFSLSSCDMLTNTEDTHKVAAERNEAKFDTLNREKAERFLLYANELSLEQIKLGQLAQQKSLNLTVKELGKTMEDAYTISLNEFILIANKKSIVLPITLSDNVQVYYNQLNNMPLNYFNKAYCDAVVNRHQEAVAFFQRVFTESSDDAIRHVALGMLPTLRKHLEYAVSCQKKAEPMN
jgi:putative membrane protein